MKLIKFRFFRTKKKEMVYGFKGCSTTYVLGMWENEKHVSEPMQYTGLKDRNGKEIWEGDIGYDDHLECYGIVTFDDGAFNYEWENICELLSEKYIEIVGNIYDNPELLEDNDELTKR